MAHRGEDRAIRGGQLRHDANIPGRRDGTTASEARKLGASRSRGPPEPVAGGGYLPPGGARESKRRPRGDARGGRGAGARRPGDRGCGEDESETAPANGEVVQRQANGPADTERPAPAGAAARRAAVPATRPEGNPPVNRRARPRIGPPPMRRPPTSSTSRRSTTATVRRSASCCQQGWSEPCARRSIAATAPGDSVIDRLPRSARLSGLGAHDGERDRERQRRPRTCEPPGSPPRS